MKQNGTNNCNGNKEWKPTNILEISDTFRYAIVILNTPILLNENYLKQLWEKAQLRVTVDGGTDRWLNWAKQHAYFIKDKPPIPDYVTGDFDSIRAETRTFIEQNLISKDRMLSTPDQNETDFTKSLLEISKIISKGNLTIDGVLVVAESCGRIDHIFGNVNTLHKVENILGNIPVFLLAHNSIAWLLKANIKHIIEIPEKLRGYWTSLIPLCGRTENISTTGLKWNLDNGVMEFGSLVSTSNSYGSESVVTVQTSKHLLWAMGTMKD
ncbi:thiamin pyrophosphokinase 1 isoform X2 [Chrysoperla carnea]|nr:thiamin pyrophosphokinase 1 isoform X2 [Chrysoperla carnea]